MFIIRIIILIMPYRVIHRVLTRWIKPEAQQPNHKILRAMHSRSMIDPMLPLLDKIEHNLGAGTACSSSKQHALHIRFLTKMQILATSPVDFNHNWASTTKICREQWMVQSRIRKDFPPAKVSVLIWLRTIEQGARTECNLCAAAACQLAITTCRQIKR